MPPKRKGGTKNKKKSSSQDSCDEKKKGPSSHSTPGLSRPARNVIQRLKKANSKSEEAYDADSEGDINTRANLHKTKTEKKLVSVVDSDSQEEVKSELMVIDDTDCSESMNIEKRGTASMTCSYKSLLKSLVNKENLTPPETHSTPSVTQVKKLDDSLFGFNMLDSPLPFSPVVAVPAAKVVPVSPSSYNSSIPHSPSHSMSSTISPVKRKIGFGFYDIPIEIPKKKAKKKPKGEQQKKVITEETGLEALRKEFQEIEMHELLVE